MKNPVAIDTDQFLAAKVTGLSDTDILDCFNEADALQGQRNYLVAVGRAIEAKVRAALPKAELLRAAGYLASNNDEDSTIGGEEADRIAAVLRGLTA
jgi:hypothetical protein